MENPAPRRGWRLTPRRRSTPSAPKLPFALRSPFRLRPACSQADKHRYCQSIHVRALAATAASRGISVRGIDGTCAMAAITARVAAGVVIGILDAVEKSSRSAGLTLL